MVELVLIILGGCFGALVAYLATQTNLFYYELLVRLYPKSRTRITRLYFIQFISAGISLILLFGAAGGGTSGSNSNSISWFGCIALALSILMIIGASFALSTYYFRREYREEIKRLGEAAENKKEG